MERVVVTGIGVCCSIGRTKDEFRQSLYNGQSGLKPIAADRFSTGSACYASKSACVVEQDWYDEAEQADETILTNFATRVIGEALSDAGLTDTRLNRQRMGLFLATTIGGSHAFMKFTRKRLDKNVTHEDYNLLFKSSGANMTGSLMRHFDFQGASSTISTACAAGTNSIGRGFDFVSRGRLDVAVSGGIDIFTELSYAGFNSLKSLSKTICQPFDRHRDGLTLGDASAFVILESLTHARQRGAHIYCEVKGYSANNEAYHPTAPNPDGSTAYLTMRQALDHGGMDASEITYINAHGTATGVNDSMELNGIRRLIGERVVHISSTKSMIGHTLGAAGSIEFIATALGMHHNFMPPSCNIVTRMTADDDAIRVIGNRAIDQAYDGALSNSFGFGGCMASIAMKRYAA
jgi:3-oxoacyl-[acyl-carrier-protein] synthase II